MDKKLLITILLLVFGAPLAHGQEINFGSYADYGLEILSGTDDLDFNEVGPIIADGSTYELGEQNASIVEIVGVKYLDVYITVQMTGTQSNALQNVNNSDTIPFTLKAAYSNQKGNVKNGAPKKYINVVNNSFSKRVPVLERQSVPPGPPPTPPTNQTNLAMDSNNPIYETLYIYLYGEITVPEGVSAGSYTGNISITVSYE